MVVIRGATTIERDEKEDIQLAVKEMLDEIVSTNGISRMEITSMVFSSTSDIHSYYPAKAAREAGFEHVSLFSATEPDIIGGLKLCIRVMIFLEKNITPKHVYLRGATILRKDLANKITIAIDGPAGSGKSTIAKLLARDYNILYLDTGAMYRACALKAMDTGVPVEDEEAVSEMMATLNLSIEYRGGVQHTIIEGVDVSELIRTPEVSMGASTISKHPVVRLKMVEKQREIADKTSLVLDGRDIGSYVLPNATFKFFLTASAEIRAERRYKELKEKGYDVDVHQLQKEIEARDLQDSTREFAPLKQAPDAVIIDTSFMTIEEALSAVKSKIQEKI